MIAADAQRAFPIRQKSIACVITSPPYPRQRVYGDDPREVGRAPTLETFLQQMVMTARAVRRVLRPDGLYWVNVGDRANGTGGAGGDYNKGGLKDGKPKPEPFHDPTYARTQFLDVAGKLAWALQADGWRLRLRLTWDKGVESRESLDHVARPRVQSETILMLAPTSSRTRFFPQRLKETGDVWHFPPGSDGPAHLAPFPDELAERCLLPSTEEGDYVLDPYAGSGTVERVAERFGRRGVSLDLYAGRMWSPCSTR